MTLKRGVAGTLVVLTIAFAVSYGRHACLPLFLTSKTLALPFCEDLTDVKQSEYAQLHAKLMTAINTQFTPDYALGDADQPIHSRDPAEYYSGHVYAYKDAKKLWISELYTRPRVVAEIYTSVKYEHGLPAGRTFVIVDKKIFRDWRVILVSENPENPVSVLYGAKFDRRPKPGHPFVGAFMKFSSHDLWYESMSKRTKECIAEPRDVPGTAQPDTMTACLINAVNPKRASLAQPDPYESTDAWIWVTEYGCVCVGTKCHGDQMTAEEKP